MTTADTTTAGEWRDVPGYETTHEVSSMGELRSKRRWIEVEGGHSHWRGGRPLAMEPNAAGRHQVNIQQGGRTLRTYRYRLVAEAFVPNPDGKPEVNHINGDPSDDRAENLEWCTREENMAHAHRLGLCGGARRGQTNAPRGERHWGSKLTDETVLEMRRLARTDRPAAIHLGRSLGVSESTAYGVIAGRSWRHLLLNAGEPGALV